MNCRLKLVCFDNERILRGIQFHALAPEQDKNRRKAIFNWAAKGLFFLREGGGYTHSGYHIKPCRQPLHATESHVRLKHKLIQNIVPF